MHNDKLHNLHIWTYY